ncbi:MAG: serine/threonine protein kinase [Labilithrix sp.]|nr:serine/threonine protein kinase [Labilithrix sp.]
MSDPALYAPGQQLPGTVYRVVRHLATGGMGSVYDVEDVSVGKRYVLKTLHPQLVSREDLAKRMEQEARALAKLQHPNIVDVVTAGMTADERRMPFYVMERLNGQNLRMVLEKKGSLDPSHCYRVAIDVLDALEHAHENAIIHRDVKPENIFLHRNTNGTTTTKLLDFGIMRLLDRKASHTQGKFLGTLRYASPEQIMGGQLGPPTDIYSLGLVLYEMIAGRGPFDDLGDAYAIGAAHAQKPAPPVSRFTNVSRDVERLVMSSIAKEPHDRPRDCFSFASELRRLLRDEEAAPKSVTAVNMLTSGPMGNASTSLPLAGTELSPVPETPRMGRVGDPTDVGMPPPTIAESTRASGPPSMPGSQPTPKKRPIDRSAETHTSDVSRATQRLAQHGTEMGIGPFGSEASDDVVRAALAERAPLEVPPASGAPSDARGSDIVFPRTYAAGGTGPISGEAQTRPPERSMLAPLLAAAAVGAMLVGGAVLLVTKPWRRNEAPAVAAAASTPAIPIASVTAVTAPVAPAEPAPSASALAAVAPSNAPARTSAPAAAPPKGPRPPPVVAPPAPSAPPVAAPATSAVRKPTPKPGAPRPEDVGFD